MVPVKSVGRENPGRISICAPDLNLKVADQLAELAKESAASKIRVPEPTVIDSWRLPSKLAPDFVES